eukprot:4973085-Ditylum_brightwellii.AAC.1
MDCIANRKFCAQCILLQHTTCAYRVPRGKCHNQEMTMTNTSKVQWKTRMIQATTQQMMRTRSPNT